MSTDTPLDSLDSLYARLEALADEFNNEDHPPSIERRAEMHRERRALGVQLRERLAREHQATLEAERVYLDEEPALRARSAELRAWLDAYRLRSHERDRIADELVEVEKKLGMLEAIKSRKEEPNPFDPRIFGHTAPDGNHYAAKDHDPRVARVISHLVRNPVRATREDTDPIRAGIEELHQLEDELEDSIYDPDGPSQAAVVERIGEVRQRLGADPLHPFGRTDETGEPEPLDLDDCDDNTDEGPQHPEDALLANCTLTASWRDGVAVVSMKFDPPLSDAHPLEQRMAQRVLLMAIEGIRGGAR